MTNKRKCALCGFEFKPKNHSDIFCGTICRDLSCSDWDYIKHTAYFWQEVDSGRIPRKCPICEIPFDRLVHKRMNGGWYLYQRYHYDNDKKWILACHKCNLFEKVFRKRFKLSKQFSVSPESLRKFLKKQRLAVAVSHSRVAMMNKKASYPWFPIFVVVLVIFLGFLAVQSTRKIYDVNEQKYGIRIDNAEVECLEFCSPCKYFYRGGWGVSCECNCYNISGGGDDG